LRLTGLLIIVLAHLPIEALMGLAWRLATGNGPTASPRRFVWARLVRDAAAETLPFSQIGGFVLGVRALRLSGPAALRGVLSMSVDLVVELGAKLPYVLAGVLTLLALAPGSGLMRPLILGLALTAAAVAVPMLGRRRLGAAFEAAIRKISQRWPVLASLRRTNAHGDINTVLDDILSQRRRLSSGFALHLLCWFLGAAELWLIFHLLGKPVSAGHALVIDSIVAGLRTFVFMVPAAAGVQEASYVLACAAFGMAPAAAVAASLARRARDLTMGAATLAVALGTDRAIIRGRRETSCRS
jgi:putative membrane protein